MPALVRLERMAAASAPGSTVEPPAPNPRPPRNRVDPRCRRWWRTQWILLFGGAALILVIMGILIPPARWWLIVPALIIAVIGLAPTLVQPAVSYRVHRWESTDDAVYARSGWLWREWRAAPLSRVQTVDLVRGPLQQRFGLATVTITTASAKGEVKIEALDAEVAEDLVHRLTVRTQATAEQQDVADRDAT